MAESTIAVDLLNPGQVFACLGIAEVAEVLFCDVAAAFDWSGAAGTTFRLDAPKSEAPLDAVVKFIKSATVTSLAPHRSDLRTEKWKAKTIVLGDGDPFPYPEPESPATLPAELANGDHRLAVDYWADGLSVTGRDNAKFWAGSGGYPGGAILRDAIKSIQADSGASADIFQFSRPQSSSFRLDWRRDYIPIDAGFSPNDHGFIMMAGYPYVEVLGAIGLGTARPLRIEKLRYQYGAAAGSEPGRLLGLPVLRAALGLAELPWPLRRFQMELNWPGKENQARSITSVTEIT